MTPERHKRRKKAKQGGIVLIALVVLCILLANPAEAQSEYVDPYTHNHVFPGHVEPFVEGSPTSFLPLTVGNQWTYEHFYSNGAYDLPSFFEPEPLSYARWALQAIQEVPGYPFYDDSVEPPYDLTLDLERELTIEITHSETIAGREYFVFSKPEYDWPPVPNLVLAGQKVRFSDEGALLFRWNEQDISLYHFSQQYVWDYTIREYPLLYDYNRPTGLRISRTFWDTKGGRGADLRGIPGYFVNLHAFMEPGFVARFQVTSPPAAEYSDKYEVELGQVYFLTGYGLAFYDLFYLGLHGAGTFTNFIRPISAVIDGEKIAHPHITHPIEVGYSHVQPSSWGQVKAFRGWP